MMANVGVEVEPSSLQLVQFCWKESPEFTAGSPKFSIDRSMSYVSSQLSIAGGPLLQRG